MIQFMKFEEGKMVKMNSPREMKNVEKEIT